MGLFATTARPAILAASRSERLRRTAERWPVTRRVVHRFVPGESLDDALNAVAMLRDSGRMVSIDYLGEDVTDADTADVTVDAYLELLDALGRRADARYEGVRPLEVSLKLSALGQALPRDGEKIALENAHAVCTAAQRAGVWVTVDAEDHTTTDSTLAILRELRKDFPETGAVLQAYLHRTEADCRALAYEGSRVRLCKGAYSEPESVAFTSRREIDSSYARCLRALMNGSGYPMLATHDPRLIEITTSLALLTGRAPESFEYQMLYGIRPAEQRRLAAAGARMRVYVPYGGDWYAYLVRRLAERPQNLAFFLRSLGRNS